MVGGGKEELRLAQGKALRDPRPNVTHLLGTDDLGGEGVWVECQLYVPPRDATRRWTQEEVEKFRMRGSLSKGETTQLVTHEH